MSTDRKLVRIGGVSAFLVAATQLVGNGLHALVPGQSNQALHVIAHSSPWPFAHVVLTVSYFLLIPFVLGTAEAFSVRSAPVRIGVPLVIMGGILGAVHITAHLTVIRDLAREYMASSSPSDQARDVWLFGMIWPWAAVLDLASLLAVFLGAILFGAEMRGDSRFPRWTGFAGIAAGLIGAAGIIIHRFAAPGERGGIVFGLSMLPLLAWIIGLGFVLLRMRVDEA